MLLQALGVQDKRWQKHTFVQQNISPFIDGTYTWNASAGAYQGTSKLEFTVSHEINEVCLCEEYLVFAENAEFTVEGNKVTEEEYKAYCETLSHTEVTWKRIIRYPLANYSKPDIGG